MTKTIKATIKGYAKMVVKNHDDLEYLRDENWLMSVSERVWNDVVEAVTKINGWQSQLRKLNTVIDMDDDEEVKDAIADLMQDEIDKMLA